jgi:transposase-like protein
MGTRKAFVGGLVAGSVGLGGLIGALAFAPGVGFAASATRASAPSFDVCIGGDGSLDAAAEAIGVDTVDLAASLRDGDTIADVARVHDVPVSDVVDEVVASEQRRLERLVADGMLTREQADALSEDLRERAIDFVNGELAPFPIVGGPPMGLPGVHVDIEGPLADAADAIGVDASDLVAALRDGDTIAEVARAHGVPVSEVVDAILAPMRADLDRAMENGWLTRPQADALAADLEERASDLVNGPPPIFPDVPGVWQTMPGRDVFDPSELSAF